MTPNSTGELVAASRPARRGAWPFGLLGMLAIAALVEWRVEARREVFGTVFANEWRSVGRAIAREAKGVRVLCLGTSLTRMGVVGRILEERLGVPAYNFATSGAQPFSIYTELRRALTAGAKPQAIVVDFTWAALETGYAWNERVLAELATFGECAELAIAARDRVFLARLALARGVPSFRCREEIRANIRAAVAGAEPPRSTDMRYFARNARVNRGGAVASPGGPAKLNPDDPTIFPRDWWCNPISERYIHKVLDLAEARGIPVFWLVPPVEPRVQARRNAKLMEDRYTRFIERTAARHRNVVVVDGRSAGYASEAFVDNTHLNRDGAVVLTESLAEILKTRLGRPVAPAWVHLPLYRADPASSRIEDIAASTRFVDRLKEQGLIR